jgi:hypothetical protein
MGTHSLEVFNDIFRKDGSYHEGVSYANYTATHLAQSTTILERFGEPNILGGINWEGYVDYIVNMNMATNYDPYEIVNFGDNGNPKSGQRGSVSRTAVPYWIAARYRSGLAQWFANERAGEPDMWALMWYDDTVAPAPPSPGNRLWISDLDWVVARTGFEADDLVVALRSGGPANHEHADRNALIVKCFGEQLVTDPYRPPYSFADPAWPMRLTIAHSAVLIDGKGHEHHNGVEGTNASQSYARLVDSGTGEGYAFWVSEATQPYRLVDLMLRRVARTVVTLFDAPAVVVIDRMARFEGLSQLQARFFGYNYDGSGQVEALDKGFKIVRPEAVAVARVLSTGQITTSVGSLPIPEEQATRHPFVEVGTVEPSMESTLVTVLSIGRSTTTIPEVSFERTSDGFRIQHDTVELTIGPDGQIVGRS